MPEAIVYLNGEFLPLSEAKVPVLDRGFIFGDGVYEVIPAYGRRLFRLDEHLQRLQSAMGINFEICGQCYRDVASGVSDVYV